MFEYFSCSKMYCPGHNDHKWSFIYMHNINGAGVCSIPILLAIVDRCSLVIFMHVSLLIFWAQNQSCAVAWCMFCLLHQLVGMHEKNRLSGYFPLCKRTMVNIDLISNQVTTGAYMSIPLSFRQDLYLYTSPLVICLLQLMSHTESNNCIECGFISLSSQCCCLKGVAISLIISSLNLSMSATFMSGHSKFCVKLTAHKSDRVFQTCQEHGPLDCWESIKEP